MQANWKKLYTEIFNSPQYFCSKAKFTAHLHYRRSNIYISITIQVHMIQPNNFKNLIEIYDVIFCRLAGISIL